MSRGIFSRLSSFALFLFLFAIEILAIAVQSNDYIKGLKVGNTEKRFICWPMTQPFFFFFFLKKGDLGSFQALFSVLDKFASFSGCKINLSKSEAIHIGS